jgi:hypothetical protein
MFSKSLANGRFRLNQEVRSTRPTAGQDDEAPELSKSTLHRSPIIPA